MELMALLDEDDELDIDNDVFSQYLIFKLSQEQYGMDILSIQEIRRGAAITEIPNTPEYVAGVINLRGIIVPVIDPKPLLGLIAQERKRPGVVVVIRGIHAEKECVVGLLADAVTDVFSLTEEELRMPPRAGCDFDKSYADGLVSVAGQATILLDSERFVRDIRSKSAVCIAEPEQGEGQ